ncbi:Lipoprotein-like protein [Sulfitobacter guttiformis KCTC 32187]|nr:Lipoprotein-like protein [Sulfitobacter guttiformis KCTC 32187]
MRTGAVVFVHRQTAALLSRMLCSERIWQSRLDQVIHHAQVKHISTTDRYALRMDNLKTRIGTQIASYLEAPKSNYLQFASTTEDMLCRTLQPGDILLVEGNTRVSTAIKYLTHSTWSHSAFYVGDHHADGDLIEAHLENGVIRVPIAKYVSFNTRICRPVSLSDEEIGKVVNYVKRSIGRVYDLKHIWDLMRYLLPEPPVPARFRRRMIALGSGDPTRAICSTLIAEGFQSIGYPILPSIVAGPQAKEIFHIRHHSLFVPRDFDLSPYFRVVKPTIELGFDYKSMNWHGSTGSGGGD